jgi:methionyl-tRNA formyltransferase
MKVDFLTPSTGWFSSVAEELLREVSQRGHESRQFENHEKLEKGDVLYILSYLKIIPQKYLGLHDMNLVIHGSDLPKGRGFSPLSWQISEDSREIAFTLFEAGDEVDSGDYYMKRKMELDGTELFHEWRSKCAAFVADMALEFLDNTDSHPPSPQSGEATFYPKRGEADDEVLPEHSLEMMFDKLRACDPDRYPAWFRFRGRKYSLRMDGIK